MKLSHDAINRTWPYLYEVINVNLRFSLLIKWMNLLK